MEGGPTREFGRRVPAAIQPTVPVKRSHHVALLVIGTFAVGGGAYALMPRENCQPPAASGMAAPAAPQPGSACASRGVSSGIGHVGYGYYSSRNGLFSSDASSGRSTSGTTDSGTVTRGGFGSFARAFTAHFSGS